jgi:large subunit ribosomal protein L2
MLAFQRASQLLRRAVLARPGPAVVRSGPCGGVRQLHQWGGLRQQQQRQQHLPRGMASSGGPAADLTRPRVVQRKPTTPSQRHTALTDKSNLFSGGPKSRLTVGLRSRAGRSRTTGHITVRHRGGGKKRKYRIIDFKRTAWSDISGVVERIEYDPIRSALIALLRHKKLCAAVPNKTRPDRYAYIICPAGLELNSEVIASRTEAVDIKVGNAMLLRYIPVGTKVHNIELQPGHGGQMCRAAGTSAQILERNDEKGLALLRLQSKEKRLVRLSCMATVGQVSNPEHKNQSFGKAGRMRWKGRRPKVRGVAMNPIDHPHGGGEGKTSGGRPSVSKWGKPTKGYRTRKKSKKNPMIVERRAP